MDHNLDRPRELRLPDEIQCGHDKGEKEDHGGGGKIQEIHDLLAALGRVQAHGVGENKYRKFRRCKIEAGTVDDLF